LRCLHDELKALDYAIVNFMNVKFLLKLVVVIAGMSVLILVFQDKFIFFPASWPSDSSLPEKLKNSEVKSVEFSALDGTSLHGVIARPVIAGNDPRKVILYNHGNAGNLIHRLEKLDKLCEIGYDVFLYDYRGFGKSSGKPDVAGAISDGKGALKHVEEKLGYKREDIIIYGESLGTGIAAEIIKESPEDFAALVLESGFASLGAQAGRKFPVIGAMILKRDLPTIETIKNYKGRLLIIHSKNDKIIPYSDSEKLFAACPSEQKKLLTLKGVGHNSPVWNLVEYMAVWKDLFKEQ
jgi:hypothetical protein